MPADWDAAESSDWNDAEDEPELLGSLATIRSRGANGDDPACEVPEPVIDALVEIAWAFPGLRVSYAGLTDRRELKFLASAGDDIGELSGAKIDISKQRKFIDALRTADIPITIEDASSDSRTRQLAEAFAAYNSRSMLLLPLRHGRDEPSGIVMLDSDKPRTWSAKESAAIERAGPLVLLGLDHARVCSQLAHTKARAAEYERRLAGLRGLATSVQHDTRILVDGLLGALDDPALGTDGAAAGSLARRLQVSISELAALNHGHTKTREPQATDLNELVDQLLPGLRILVGRNTRVLGPQHPEPLVVAAHRAGLERLLLNLVVHANAAQNSNGSIVFETSLDGSNARVSVYGDALRSDDALRRLDQNSATATVDELGMGLWLVKTEALLHGATLRVETEGERVRVDLTLPLMR